MKFLIDECLSPTLEKIARKQGFAESTHVTWIGLRSHQDAATRGIPHAFDTVSYTSFKPKSRVLSSRVAKR